MRVLSLGEPILAEMTRQFDHDSGQRGVYRRALRHVPALLADLRALGFGQASKVKRQRRPIDSLVWAELDRVCKEELGGDLDRQVLLRLLIRRELGIQPDSQPEVPPASPI